MMGKFKDFLFRFKVFCWYLLTEPIVQLREVLNKISVLGKALNKTFTWSYVFVILAGIAMFVDNQTAVGLLLMLLLLTILLWEWERGYFMHRYREQVKKKANKEKGGKE